MERKFMKGCEAIAEAAVRAGCRFFSGYPITPQNEIPEYMSNVMPEKGGIFVQAESEVASINMVYGAACTGTRAMTSSSSPGVSLKSEGISYMAAARLPAVIVNVMRAGPGVGTIQPAQNDYLQATKALGHGGFHTIVYAPATLQEAVDLTYKAFDIAFRDRNPVLVIPDGFIGAIMEPVTLPPERTPGSDDISWALGDSHGRKIHRAYPGNSTEQLQEDFNKECAAMYERWAEEDVEFELYQAEDAEYLFAAYGTSARICKSAVKALRGQGVKVGLIRPITLYPFPFKPFRELNESQIKGIIDVEMAIPAQMADDVRLAVQGRIPVETVLSSGGKIINIQDLLDKVRSLCR